MKPLIVYDSEYGNTQKIAERIADTLGSQAQNISKVSVSDIKHSDLVIFGSPTQGGNATKPMQNYIDSLPNELLKDKSVATFDTRFAANEHSNALRLLMKIISFAAPRMATALRQKGARLVTKPEGFFVHDTKGPINPGELERAENWSLTLLTEGGMR